MFGAKSHKYIDIITALFVAVLLISNITSTKMVALGPFDFDGGTLLFPLSYIFGDVLTEVYGYKRSRRVIWIGFASALLMTFTIMLVIALPSAEGSEELGDAFNQVLGLTPRIMLASLVAYLAGEFSNSYLMAKIKVAMKGKKLWVRTISSTLVGQFLDTVLFVLIAFYGLLPTSLVWAILISNYIFKCGIEILFTPITYKTISFLKKAEGEDHYDKNTDFNPFTLSK